jgi:hypothetical protein
VIARSVVPITFLFLIISIQSEVDIVPSEVEVIPKPNYTSLGGFVLDEQTLMPIQWASVQIRNGPWGACSLENGSFLIHGLDPGNHDLIVMMLGYKSESRTVHIKPDSITVVVFTLSRDKVNK